MPLNTYAHTLALALNRYYRAIGLADGHTQPLSVSAPASAHRFVPFPKSLVWPNSFFFVHCIFAFGLTKAGVRLLVVQPAGCGMGCYALASTTLAVLALVVVIAIVDLYRFFNGYHTTIHWKPSKRVDDPSKPHHPGLTTRTSIPQHILPPFIRYVLPSTFTSPGKVVDPIMRRLARVRLTVLGTWLKTRASVDRLRSSVGSRSSFRGSVHSSRSVDSRQDTHDSARNSRISIAPAADGAVHAAVNGAVDGAMSGFVDGAPAVSCGSVHSSVHSSAQCAAPALRTHTFTSCTSCHTISNLAAMPPAAPRSPAPVLTLVKSERAANACPPASSCERGCGQICGRGGEWSSSTRLLSRAGTARVSALPSPLPTPTPLCPMTLPSVERGALNSNQS